MVVLVVVAALAAPGRAAAHHSPAITYTAYTAATTPTIDGTIGSGEWTDAAAYDVPFAGHPATVRFKHDATYLYVVATIADSSPVNPSFDVYFDGNHDGVKDVGEDAILGFTTFGSDFFYSPDGSDGPNHYSDLSTTPSRPTAGTNDVIAAGSTTSTSATIELRHPLCNTSDSAHDVCLTTGGTAGVEFQYEAASTLFVRAPGADTFVPSDWADLVVSASTLDIPPSGNVTQPIAGSVLRGTVAVAANATDDNGVTSVDFAYFDGTLPFHPLGTDTTAPYTATFDTTQFANTAVLDGTIYATAHDTAGQTTTFGNGITIDNAGGRIVFETDRDGNSEIYSMNTDGTNPTRLTNIAAVDTRPSLSPDGSLIAFESTRSGTRQVWLMNVDGTNQQVLTTTGANGAPSFSPDGTKIAFESNRGGNWEIFVMNADGTAQTNLTNNAADDVDATWKPDGTQIAFDSTRDGNREIYKMNANGSGQTRLTNDASLDADPDWSPDAQSILFVSGRGSATSVWKMNADGTSQQNITNATIFDADPTWSPDGQHIAFVRDATGQNFNVWTARPDGSAQLKLTNGTAPQRNSFPDWGTLPAATPTSATISISGDSSSIAGAASVLISGIPVDAIRGATAQTNAAAPLGGIPLGGIPLGGIPLGGIPLGGIPLGGIGFTAANLSQNGLGGVPLSTIPLKLPDRWETHFAGTAFAGTPLQNVTLAQVVNTSVVSGVTLRDLDLSSSPLGGIPLGGIALGGIPLGGIAIGGDATATPDKNLTDWCAYINSQPGFAGSCSGGSSLSGQTMIGLALGGIPLGGIPLGGIPLGGIPLGGIPLGGIPVGTPLGGINVDGSPLGGIPLGGINLAGSPLGGIPLGGINFSVSPLGGIPLAGIKLSSSPLGGIPLGGIPLSAKSLILNCPTGAFTCPDTATLAQAAAAGAIKSGATLGQLGYYTDANGSQLRIEDIGYYCIAGTPSNAACQTGQTPITLADFIKGLPPSTTLEDLIATLLSATAYDWEALPFNAFPLQDFSSDGGVMTYHVAFKVDGTGVGAVSSRIGVHIPPGTRYVPGSSSVTAPLSIGEPTLLSPENELTWNVSGIQLGVNSELSFQARAGLDLGTESATAKIAASGIGTVQAALPAKTEITQTFPPPIEGGPPIIAPNTLYVGYTPNGADRDYFRLPVPPAGTQVTVHLSHLNVDDDLVVFGPAPAPLRVPKPGATAQGVPDVAYSLYQRTQPITPEVQADVPFISGQQVLGVSDNRGLGDEEVSVGTAEDASGYLTIQVTSYDGGYSPKPWMLRVEETPALPLPTLCTRPPTVTADAGVAKSLPTIPAGASTLYLINAQRFGDLYGGTAETSVLNKLQTLASRTDAAGGAVIPVEGNADVAAAYAAWTGDDASYCSPGRKNDVVRAIGRLLDQIVSPSVKYVVLVGDDPVVPYGSILDNTSFANERGYATTFYGLTNDEYLSSYGLGFLPSDDPYGDNNYPGDGPYVPELAVGRLTETPSQIMSLIDQYVSRNGAIAPTRSVDAAYDFLKDGGQSIGTALKGDLGPSSSQTLLINDTWSKSDLISALFPGTNTPEIDSINAHFDHHRSLPADENAANRESILFTTDDVASRGSNAVLARIGFSMGCHSGVAVSDKVVSATLMPDWPQTWGAGGGANWMGNTGFGLGDTAAVAYSERLNALFAARLDGSMTVGQALMFAKQEYAAIPNISGYDLKVVDEATMYGLPMYRLGSVAPPSPLPPLPTFVDAATGLTAASFSVSPTFTKVTTPIGSYYTVNGDASFVNRRPIEPTTKLDVTEPGFLAHGAVVTGAASVEEGNFDAAFSRVVDDLSALSPELVGDVIFPSRLQSIASLSSPTGLRQRLLLYAGQFRSNGVPNTLGIGVQRRFTNLAGTILYAPSTVNDFSSPTFGPVSATAAGSTVGFAVDVSDPDGPSDVKRVFALYLDGSGVWKTAEFSNTDSRWSGAGPVTGTTVEWFIQAVDANGNVGVTSNKAHVESLVPPPSVGNITAQLSGSQQSGWYTGPVGITITAGSGVAISYSLDGAVFTSYGGAFQVTGTGVHVLAFQGSDGSSGSVAIPIDVTAPTISIASPGIVELGQTAPFGFFSCADAGSGVASCTTNGIDTSSITPSGTTRPVTVAATDRVGNSSSKDGTYRVLYPFRGFFQPVDNLPVVNVAKGGSGVPVKFSLLGNRGLSIFESNYPRSVQINCQTTDPTSAIEQTVTAGGSSLSYDSTTDQYTYTWKTDKAWAGTCRQLVVKLVDGNTKVTNFKFT